MADLNRRDSALDRFFAKQCGSQTRLEPGCRQALCQGVRSDEGRMEAVMGPDRTVARNIPEVRK